MKIVFFGDSVTDMGRERGCDGTVNSFGRGYPLYVAGELFLKEPGKYEILNRGISGNKILDLYARVKLDVWNHQPDVLSILIGVNDVWHDLGDKPNGVELPRFEKAYRMLIEETLQRLPNVKIILCEPFVLRGECTNEHYNEFLKLKAYAERIKAMAEEYGLYFLPLQEKFEQAAAKNGAKVYLADGIHPHLAGAKLIADEWLKLFYAKVK